jgi:hypothetical protein
MIAEEAAVVSFVAAADVESPKAAARALLRPKKIRREIRFSFSLMTLPAS